MKAVIAGLVVPGYEPSNEDKPFGRFEVYDESKVYGAPLWWIFWSMPPIDMTRQKVGLSDYTEKEAFYKKVCDTGNAIVEKARSARNRFDLLNARAFWEGQDTKVLAALYRHQPFLDDKLWKERPDLLVALREKLDPIQILRTLLRRTYGEKALDVVRDWALQSSSTDRERALVEADLIQIMKVRFPNEGLMVLAIQYLKSGGVPNAAKDRVSRAIAQGKFDDFMAAWRDILKAPELLEQYKSDANFLHSVEASLGEEARSYVMTALRLGGAAAKNEQFKLTSDEKDKLERYADSCCSTMKPELEATVYCKDKIVVDAIQRYVLQIGTVLSASRGNKEVHKVKYELALDELKAAWKGYDSEGMSLQYRINDGMSGHELKKSLSMIRSSPTARNKMAEAQEAAERLKAAEAKVNKAKADVPLKLTASEKGAIEPAKTACLDTLYKELVTDAQATFAISDDDIVLAALKTYKDTVNEKVVASDNNDPRHVFGRDKRRAEAIILLEEAFKDKDPEKKTLETRMIDGLQGDAETEGSNFFADAREQHRKKSEAWYGYEKDLSDAEQQRVEFLARKWATLLADELDDTVVTDADVVARFREAHTEMVQAVMPRSLNFDGGNISTQQLDPRIKTLLDGKVEAGMAMIKEKYDALYGSMIKDVFDGVDDDDKRHECLRYVGHTSDYTKKLADDVLAGREGTGNDKLAYDRKLTEFRQEVTKLAEALADELDDTFVDEDTVVGHTENFEAMRTSTYASLTTGSSTFNEAHFLKFLDAAFAPLGGSLRHAIADRVKPKSKAEDAIEDLGLPKNVDAINSPVDAAGLSNEEKSAKERILEDVKKAFYAVEGGARRKSRHRPIGWLRSIMGKVRLGDKSLPFLRKVWKEVNGIDLLEQIRMKYTSASRSLSGMAEALGVPVDELKKGATVPDQKAVQGKLGEYMSDPSKTPDELKFDPLKCSGGFNLIVATNRAKELHANARDRQKLTLLLAGNREENRVVREVFKQLYGYDITYRLKSQMGMHGKDKAEQYSRLAETGGYEDDLSKELEASVRDQNIEAIYKNVLLASNERKTQVLNNGALLYKMRRTFDQEQYDRIYRSLTGEITLGDMMRTRDTGSAWTLGIGTDEKGSEADVKLFFKWLKRSIEDANPKEGVTDPKKIQAVQKTITAQVRAKALFWLDDRDTREMLDSEFGQEELLKMKQLIMGAGQQTAADKIYEDVEGWGTGDQIMTRLRAAKDADRTKIKNDPILMARIYGDLQGGDLREALNILAGKSGKDYQADLDKAMAGLDVEEHKIFETVLKMSPDELEALAKDTFRVAKIRRHLDNNTEERQLFDSLIAGARSLGDKAEGHHLPSQQRDAARKRQRAHLVLKYTVMLKHGAYENTDALLEAAQRVYSEKGEFADPTKKAKPAPVDPNKRVKEDPKEELFTSDERNEVWAAVESVVREETDGPGGEVYTAVRRAVKKLRDPSDVRLQKGFDGKDNDKAIRAAIAGASVETVVGDWSNVIRQGKDNTSLMDRYEDWVLKRNRVAELQKAAPAGKPPPAQQEKLDKAKQESLIAENGFVRFRLDVHPYVTEVLAQGWKGTLFKTGDKDLLNYIGLVRGRVLGLSNEDISDAIKNHTKRRSEVADAYGDSAEKARADAVTAAVDAEDMKVFNNEDRQMRSKIAHKRDEYAHKRGQGSMANAGKKDDIYDLETQRLFGTLGRAEEGDLEKGKVGRIDRVWKNKLQDRLDAYSVALTEYDAAKAALASALKWIAIIIITAVATALTGPGGPTLLAAMLTAAANAGAAAVIDEAVMGKDYEFVQEGLKNVVKDTAMAALTFGLARGWEGLSATQKHLGFLGDKLKRFEAWEQALAEGASKSWAGAGAFILESSAKAVLTQGTTDLKDGAIAALDPAELKYRGFMQSMSHMSTVMDGKLGTMGKSMGQALLTTMVTSTATVIKGRVSRAWYGDAEPTLPGVDLPPGAPPGDTGLGAAGFAKMKESLQPRELLGDLYDQVANTFAEKLKLGSNALRSSSWSEDEVSAFLVAYLKTRAGKAAQGFAEGVKDERNRRAAADALIKTASELETALQSVDAADRDFAKQHFKAFLTGGVRDFDKAVTEWQRKWGQVQGDLKRRGATPDYKAWVFSDPEKVDERLRFSVEAYQAARKEADATRQRYEEARRQGTLTLDPEAKKFYEAMLADPNNLIMQRGLVSGAERSTGPSLGVRGMDVTTPQGQAEFMKRMVATKRAWALHHAEEVSADWPEERKKAFKAYVESLGTAQLPEMNPTDHSGNARTARGFAREWAHRADAQGSATTFDDTRRDRALSMLQDPATLSHADPTRQAGFREWVAKARPRQLFPGEPPTNDEEMKKALTDVYIRWWRRHEGAGVPRPLAGPNPKPEQPPRPGERPPSPQQPQPQQQPQRPTTSSGPRSGGSGAGGSSLGSHRAQNTFKKEEVAKFFKAQLSGEPLKAFESHLERDPDYFLKPKWNEWGMESGSQDLPHLLSNWEYERDDSGGVAMGIQGL